MNGHIVILSAHCNSETYSLGDGPKPGPSTPGTCRGAFVCLRHSPPPRQPKGQLRAWTRLHGPPPPPPGSPPPALAGCTRQPAAPTAAHAPRTPALRPPLTQFCALLLSLTFLHRLPGISMAAERGCPAAESPGAEQWERGRGAGRSREKGRGLHPGLRRALTCAPASDRLGWSLASELRGGRGEAGGAGSRPHHPITRRGA